MKEIVRLICVESSNLKPETSRPIAENNPSTAQGRRIREGILSLPYLKRRRHLRSSYPPFVYRYFSDQLQQEFIADYIINSLFWLSSPTKFNDPFDMSAYVTMEGDIHQRTTWVREAVNENFSHFSWKDRQKIITKTLCDPNLHDNVVESFRKNIEQNGVICFSEDSRNLLMWSHYANNHKGFVLQFEIARDFECLSALQEVKYIDAYPHVNWINKSSKDLVTVMTRKHPHWRYEREARIVIINGAAKYLPFRPEALTGIILGCRADHILKERLLDLLRIRASKSPIPLKLYSAVQHPRKYQIILKRIGS